MIRFKDLNLFVSSESLFHSQREKFVPLQDGIDRILSPFVSTQAPRISMKNFAFALLYMTSQSAWNGKRANKFQNCLSAANAI